jgi:hypothetical protein
MQNKKKMALPLISFNSSLIEVVLSGLTGTFWGLVSGFVVALLIYGIDRLAITLFDFYLGALFSGPGLSIGMLVGALFGAFFGSLCGIKKLD